MRDVTHQNERDLVDLSSKSVPSVAPLDLADVNAAPGKDASLPSDVDNSLASDEMPKEITKATINATVPNGTSTDVAVQVVQVQAQLNGVNKVIKEHMSEKKTEASATKPAAKKAAADGKKAAAGGGAKKPAGKQGLPSAKPAAKPPVA